MIEEVDHPVGLFICQSLMTGYAKLLGMNLLRNGEAQVIPLTIALLMVGWYGVMYLRFHIIITKILLEQVAPFAEDREYMPDAIAITLRNTDQRILHLIYI